MRETSFFRFFLGFFDGFHCGKSCPNAMEKIWKSRESFLKD